MLRIKVFDELKALADELMVLYRLEQKLGPDHAEFLEIRKRRESLEIQISQRLKKHETLIETVVHFHETDSHPAR